MASIDLDELAKQIRSMGVRSQLYKVLKAELSERGWWKNKPRWTPPPDYWKNRPKKK